MKRTIVLIALLYAGNLVAQTVDKIQSKNINSEITASSNIQAGERVSIDLSSGDAKYKFDKIRGFGLLQIGVTTIDVIPKIEAMTIYPAKHVYKWEHFFQIEDDDVSRIIELKYDTVEPTPLSFATEMPGVKVFYINKALISDIVIKAIFLTFYNDTLISISCNASKELTDAVEAKYGEPKRSFSEKPVNCTFTYTGNKVEYKESTYTNDWSHDQVKAINTLWIYYDYECKKQGSNTLMINTPQQELVYNYNKIYDKQIQANKNAALKSKLKDF